MPEKKRGLYIVLLSIHGLIRWKNLELGRDSDTGGQTLYVVELAQALAKIPGIDRVDLVTQRVIDEAVSDEYAEPVTYHSKNLRIVRIDAGPQEYLAKEKLWDHLDVFADNLHTFWRENDALPDIIHSHYADAGYVGSQLSILLGIPQVHTGHSLGRVKRRRLLASGLKADEIETLYNMSRRIEAEEQTLTTAERVITSTHQEIQEQYELYDHYQPEMMRVVPPGTNLQKFSPATGDERKSELFAELTRHLKNPEKPIILALSRPDQRKNISALVEAFGQSEKLQKLANLLIIAGNRDDVDELEDNAQEVFYELFAAVDRYDLYGKVVMPKHHQRDQVPMIYQITAASGGVFVNPALTEPFGLTLIEAAACGLPIVATEDGGPVDIIGNCRNGFLIDPLEPESISEALLKLLKDRELWQKFAQQGLEGVQENYSWQSHARRYFKIIAPIAERSEVLERRPVRQRAGLYRDRAIVSDLDQNLIGDTESLAELVQLIRQHRSDAYFIIATGRRLNSALKFLKKHKIPEPDILVAGSGSEIYHAPKFTADTAWTRHIDYQWSPRIIKKLLAEFPGIKNQPRKEQSLFKLSYYIDPEKADIEEIKQMLHREELSFFLQTAFGQFLDILPLRASKGMALRYVAERLNLPLESVFVAGGSGADEDMMRGNTLAAVVANRHHEEMSQLVDFDRIYYSQKPYSAGILEALEFYDFSVNAGIQGRKQKTMSRLLLCTDMDRTVIPNGSQPEHPEARAIFHRLCALPEVKLVYVTGRNLPLVEEAIEQYKLPMPCHVITDVGTKIYRKTENCFEELNNWQEEIAMDWQGKSRDELHRLLAPISELKLQEQDKQSNFKLSYYLPLEADFAMITVMVKEKLSDSGVSASVITSVDEPAGVGLLDVLPKNATKLHGLNFLRQYLGYSKDVTIFAGDSGNDLPVLESSVRSILVANAAPELQKQGPLLARRRGNSPFYYQADNTSFYLGGNYSAGVVQGVLHYRPDLRGALQIP